MKTSKRGSFALALAASAFFVACSSPSTSPLGDSPNSAAPPPPPNVTPSTGDDAGAGGGKGTLTTLTLETENNTSASSAFETLSNGDVAPGNVSKISIKSLLPAGYKGQVLAHWMPWWSCSSSTGECDGVHASADIVRVHYSTQDPAQIDRTLEDMISRGYDGVMVAEANSGGVDTASTLAMAAEMPKYPSFQFSVSENHLDAISGADAETAQLMTDMKFASAHYFSLPNYLKINGRPVVYVFDNASVDWVSAAANASGHPLFVLDGPSHATSTTGGFYWFGDLAHDTAESSATVISNLDSFLTTVAGQSDTLYSGAFFKGFDDKYATWTLGRSVDQACGLTFVRSVSAVAAKLAASPSNLPLMQGATWDDYEEGTEVETGVDNCASVTADVSGTIVKPVPAFTGVGSEETVDHYTVFVSTDGENLLDAGDVAIGAALDVASLDLNPGAYKVFVKMVGKSHILNHMSPAASLTIAAAK